MLSYAKRPKKRAKKKKNPSVRLNPRSQETACRDDEDSRGTGTDRGKRSASVIASVQSSAEVTLNKEAPQAAPQEDLM